MSSSRGCDLVGAGTHVLVGDPAHGHLVAGDADGGVDPQKGALQVLVVPPVGGQALGAGLHRELAADEGDLAHRGADHPRPDLEVLLREAVGPDGGGLHHVVVDGDDPGHVGHESECNAVLTVRQLAAGDRRPAPPADTPRCCDGPCQRRRVRRPLGGRRQSRRRARCQARRPASCPDGSATGRRWRCVAVPGGHAPGAADLQAAVGVVASFVGLVRSGSLLGRRRLCAGGPVRPVEASGRPRARRCARAGPPMGMPHRRQAIPPRPTGSPV